jgi:hypothetical protein
LLGSDSQLSAIIGASLGCGAHPPKASRILFFISILRPANPLGSSRKTIS